MDRKGGVMSMFGSPRRTAFLTVMICILITACAPSRKTGTVLNEGTVTGMEYSDQGQLGAYRVELVVKLDDGTEVTAIWMKEQGKDVVIKGRRVEVEREKDSKGWKVIRILQT
jgi:major membrane immunogen (membrane-anchored lipoprotein)